MPVCSSSKYTKPVYPVSARAASVIFGLKSTTPFALLAWTSPRCGVDWVKMRLLFAVYCPLTGSSYLFVVHFYRVCETQYYIEHKRVLVIVNERKRTVAIGLSEFFPYVIQIILTTLVTFGGSLCIYSVHRWVTGLPIRWCLTVMKKCHQKYSVFWQIRFY